MGKVKLKISIDGRYKFKIIKIRPERNYLLNPKTYGEIWNYIIGNVLRGDEKNNMLVLLTMNDLIRQNNRLYSSIIENIENGKYKVIHKKEIKPSEPKYAISADQDALRLLIENLNDMDALELMIPKYDIRNEDISRIVDNKDIDISKYIKYIIYFNGIHIGLNIEIYNGDIENIMNVFERIKISEDLNVLLDFST